MIMAAPHTHRSLSSLQRAGLIIGVIAFVIPFIIDVPGLDETGERMLGIFLLAVVFWVTEAIPLVATATVIIALEALLIAQGAILPVGEGAPTAAAIFSVFGNPAVILIMGGFMIANGATKFGLDQNLAAIFIRPFASSGRKLVLGVMIVTTVLGQFISNTATTAAMFAIVMPILATISSVPTRTAIALGIPLAASIGGMGSPVGTPPNAIAVGALANQGIQVSFIQWMAMAAPFWIPLLLLAWFLITRPIPKDLEVSLELEASFDTSPKAKLFYAITAFTILMWMTEPLHGIASATVGFFPIVLMLSLRVFTGKDLQKLDWSVLWLVAGGIALGNGIVIAGLDQWLLSSFDWASMGGTLVIVILVFLTLGLGNVISNTAIANLVVPLAIGFAGVIDAEPATVAILLALAASMGFALPVSTPPNAIAYGTGFVSTKDMATAGLALGAVGGIALSFVMPWLWQALGLV